MGVQTAPASPDPPRRPRWPAVALVLSVPALLAAFVGVPMPMDSPVRSIDLPDDRERMLVFFGYVDCPQVCPGTMQALKGIYEAYQRIGDPGRLGIAFVNLTAASDGVAARYARAFHPDFLGLQAGPRDRGALMRELGVRFDRDDDSPAAWHTDFVYVLVRTEDGWRLRTVLKQRPFEPEDVVARLLDLRP